MAGGSDHYQLDIKAILASEGVDYLLAGEEKVSFPSGDGNRICLLFSANWCKPCKIFTPKLVQLYNTVRRNGEKLEIILISLDRDEIGFTEQLKCMPWLAVPFNVNLQKRVAKLYQLRHIPSFIPLALGADGKSMELEEDAVGLIQDYGADAFPFTQKRKEELKAIDEAKRHGGKLDQLLEPNRLISRQGTGDTEVWVSKLVGRTIGLYFGALWCPPCNEFTKQLMESYNELIITTNRCFEIVFVSTDRNHEEFDLNISNMPWLAIPYEDKMRQDLCRIFDIKGIPALVLLGPDGKTISTNGRAMISLYGAKAYPFTESRILEMEAMLRKEGDGLPDRVRDPKHEHILKLEMAKAYVCDSCKKQGRFWAFSCDICDYDLHPTCVEEIF